MILVNTATTNTANVTAILQELRIPESEVIDAANYKRKRGVFDLKRSVHNADAPLRLLNIFQQTEALFSIRAREQRNSSIRHTSSHIHNPAALLSNQVVSLLQRTVCGDG